MRQCLVCTARVLMLRSAVVASAMASVVATAAAQGIEADSADELMGRISCSSDQTHFVSGPESRRITLWGVNYDRNEAGRLLEDYWHDEWQEVVSDFAEIRALNANVVRIHLQLGRFMNAPDAVNAENLGKLEELIALAERSHLYLDLTGLGCYHKQDVPDWYNELSEQDRWAVQARFWRAVAEVGKGSPAVFCYDLMNEPILPGKKPATEWLTGELGGKHFVQRISLDLAGRTREDVAAAWVSQMTEAIRSVDQEHLITVGVIPWALTFKGAKPLFYSERVGSQLDFVSVHFYPRAGEVQEALDAFRVYDIGKPIVVEEMFPLKCSIPELQQWIDESSDVCDGWISFYWGRTVQQYRSDESLRSAIVAQWLEHFQKNSPLLRDQ